MLKAHVMEAFLTFDSLMPNEEFFVVCISLLAPPEALLAMVARVRRHAAVG